MKIAMHVDGMPFDGTTILDGKSLGGSESAGYFMAKELAKLGHELFVFTNSQKTGTWDGVTYEFTGQRREETPLGDRFHYALQVPHDVTIIQRFPQAFLFPYNSKLNIWWLHDLGLRRYGSLIQNHLPNIDQIFTVSNFHAKQISEVYDIPERSITPVKNGVDYSMFTSFLGNRKEEKSLVFASRPERGLESLVQEGGIMERLPDYKLYVCTYSNSPPSMEGFYNYLYQRCSDLPNVTNCGTLGKMDLYDLLSRCKLYVYPTSFEDTSNIMILESNGLGTPFIGFNHHAALQETGEYGGVKWVSKSMKYEYGSENKTKLTKKDIKKFVFTIKNICEDKEEYARLQHKALQKRQPWEEQALHWEKVFIKLFQNKTKNKRRLLKHFEKNSDVMAMLALEDYPEDFVPNFNSNYSFLLNNNFEEHYNDYYKYEEKRGVIYGPEDLSGNSRFEQTKRIIGELKPESIMDYGCAHGHYIMNLWRYFPDIFYSGFDMNQKNIEIAKKWKDDGNLSKDSNIEFFKGFVGGGYSLPSSFTENGKYDLILLGEILEHVENPSELVTELIQYLNKEGWVLITVPYGPWESLGYKEHVGWRAHIHHLERQDLKDMFGDQKNFKMIALPFNHYLGHYLVYFQPSTPPSEHYPIEKKGYKTIHQLDLLQENQEEIHQSYDIGQIDYKRKFLFQNPQETLSVCMIVKDGEYSLGRTLKSIEGIADEIIIGIDSSTADKTKEVALGFTDKVFHIEPALETGFAKARMRTIEKATMDWIFWIDTDETLENPENLRKYLCQNCFNGYGIKQHHYAIEPASLFKTDFPCRLFRNKIGIKFFGFVHEHPELELNEGPGKTHLIEDVAIMHTGYSTEVIRRERFKRNFPLMKIDKEKNPERKLGKFLWVRDIAHYTRYLLEQNGGIVDDQIIEISKEGIKGWRELLKLKDIRLIADSVPFYSECVFRLKNGNGIEFKYRAFSAKAGARFSFPHEIEGLFANTDDIKNFVSVMTNEITEVFDKEYF